MERKKIGKESEKLSPLIKGCLTNAFLVILTRQIYIFVILTRQIYFSVILTRLKKWALEESEKYICIAGRNPF